MWLSNRKGYLQSGLSLIENLVQTDIYDFDEIKQSSLQEIYT